MAWWNKRTSEYASFAAPNIRKNLKYLRERNGLSMGELSKELNIPRGSIGCYESYGEISQNRLEIFANFYGVESDKLLMKHEDFVKFIQEQG